MMSQLAYSLLFAPNVLVALVVLAVFLLMIRRRMLAIICLLTGLFWVLMWSLPAVTVMAGGWLENRFAQRAPDHYPQAQAIVVLGGHIQGNRKNWFEPYERDSVIGRETLAADLYQANRAPLILLSGGALVGKISDTANMALNLQARGVPENAILQETASQSTLENATLTQQTLKQLDLNQILLVTSALHMPRAMAAFNKASFSVTAAPLSPQINLNENLASRPWSPDLHTLLASRSIIKEYAGLIVYWLHDLWD